MASNTSTQKKTDTANKTTTKKPMKKTPVKKDTTAVKKETVIGKEPRVYKPNDIILCKSICAGTLEYMSKKSGFSYTWANMGDECEVEFQDLKALKLSHSTYVYYPWFIIEDKELLEQWSDLEDVYKGVDILESPESFEKKITEKTLDDIIENGSKGILNAIKCMAGQLIRTGQLDSIRVCNLIDNKLGTSLKMLMD